MVLANERGSRNTRHQRLTKRFALHGQAHRAGQGVQLSSAAHQSRQTDNKTGKRLHQPPRSDNVPHGSGEFKSRPRSLVEQASSGRSNELCHDAGPACRSARKRLHAASRDDQACARFRGKRGIRREPAHFLRRSPRIHRACKCGNQPWLASSRRKDAERPSREPPRRLPQNEIRGSSALPQ